MKRKALIGHLKKHGCNLISYGITLATTSFILQAEFPRLTPGVGCGIGKGIGRVYRRPDAYHHQHGQAAKDDSHVSHKASL